MELKGSLHSNSLVMIRRILRITTQAEMLTAFASTVFSRSRVKSKRELILESLVRIKSPRGQVSMEVLLLTRMWSF